MNETPGYNRRITVKISATKAGQKRALYFSPLGMRWLPLALEKAELLLATGQADAYKPCAPPTRAQEARR